MTGSDVKAQALRYLEDALDSYGRLVGEEISTTEARIQAAVMVLAPCLVLTEEEAVSLRNYLTERRAVYGDHEFYLALLTVGEA